MLDQIREFCRECEAGPEEKARRAKFAAESKLAWKRREIEEAKLQLQKIEMEKARLASVPMRPYYHCKNFRCDFKTETDTHSRGVPGATGFKPLIMIIPLRFLPQCSCSATGTVSAHAHAVYQERARSRALQLATGHSPVPDESTIGSRLVILHLAQDSGIVANQWKSGRAAPLCRCGININTGT